jgi:hypothetical protein
MGWGMAGHLPSSAPCTGPAMLRLFVRQMLAAIDVRGACPLTVDKLRTREPQLRSLRKDLSGSCGKVT